MKKKIYIYIVVLQLHIVICCYCPIVKDTQVCLKYAKQNILMNAVFLDFYVFYIPLDFFLTFNHLAIA